jgi:hypothetical protein
MYKVKHTCKEKNLPLHKEKHFFVVANVKVK